MAVSLATPPAIMTTHQNCNIVQVSRSFGIFSKFSSNISYSYFMDLS